MATIPKILYGQVPEASAGIDHALGLGAASTEVDEDGEDLQFPKVSVHQFTAKRFPKHYPCEHINLCNANALDIVETSSKTGFRDHSDCDSSRL